MYAHWWIGFCKDVGSNVGHAWLNPHASCPSDAIEGNWRQSGTDETISGEVVEANLEFLKTGKHNELL